jgi:NAD(P)H-dependent FMN reductase
MKLLVIIASTRPGRIGRTIGDWFVKQAVEHNGFDVEIADLAELHLPLLDEPAHPSTGRYEHQHTKDWSARVAAADAFVFVMPEYNHSFSAPLKNAIDYLNREWAYKPVAFVSYGGVSGGLRAVQAIKPVVAALRMTPVVDAVTIPMVHSLVDDQGFHPTDIVSASAKSTLDELVRVSKALAALRAAQAAA